MLRHHRRHLSTWPLVGLLAACSAPTASAPTAEASSGSSSSSGASHSTSSGIPTPTGQTTGRADDTSTQDTSCCTPHADPACDDNAVAACVCRQEASCCAFAWDEACVSLAEQHCGGCAPVDTTTTTGDEADDACCRPVGTPGCADAPDIEACVCAFDDFCCLTSWDSACVNIAQQDCGASCSSFGEGDCCEIDDTPGCEDRKITSCTCDLAPECCGGPWNEVCTGLAHYVCAAECGLPPGNQEDCCTNTDTPGCNDMVVSDCVCMLDTSCCAAPWTDDCIQTGVNGCGLLCPGFEQQPPCCQIQMGPMCGDEDLEACVCPLDPYCCDVQWDEICVDVAEMGCSLDCGPEETGGTGGTGGSSST